MKFEEKHRRPPGWLTLVGVLVCFGLLVASGKYSSASNAIFDENTENVGNTLFLPTVLLNNNRITPFGVESNQYLLEGGELLDRGVALDVSWVRLGGRISWKNLQPNPGDAIDWAQLSQFEEELLALKKAGITPLVTVQQYPHWAVEGDAWHGQPTSCGPLRADTFDEFAEFMRAVVNRYSISEYDVHDWELGNEPDVDPELHGVDNVFGCWGDKDDPFYGGRHYGEMIKVVSQAIKAADPMATVWLGGLLLSAPETNNPLIGKPELFLKGVLEAGAAPFFDVVGYHWYPPYLNMVVDHDLYRDDWSDWGGGTIGKAQFLRQIMDEYGVDKPVVLNETGLMCVESSYYCNPLPVSSFYEMQADFLIRSFVRGLSVNVEGFVWYTLDGPGWRHTGLLNENNDPHEAYFAYQHLASQLKNAIYAGAVSHGLGVEAYAFRRGNVIVQVVWARANEVIPVTFPGSKFVAAYGRIGDHIVPVPVGDDYQLDIQFTPTFIVLKP